MAFISTTAACDADGDVRALYEREQHAWGYVPNYAKVFSHRPEIIELAGRLFAAIRRNLEPRRYEIATLAAAHALRSSYCSLAHGKALMRLASPEEVRAVVAESAGGTLPAADAAVAAFARKVALDASAVAAEDVERLRQHGLTDPEIFDVAATAAARAFFTKVLDAVGATPDAAFLELEDALRATLTPGREIDRAVPERLQGADRDAPGAAGCRARSAAGRGDD